MRLGRRVETEKKGHHFLDLTFVGTSIANDGLFDLQRAVLVDGDTLRHTGNNGNAANMSELQRTLDVGSIEQIFHGHPIGTKSSNDLHELGVDEVEFLGKRERSHRRHDPVVLKRMAVTIRFDSPIARCHGAGVNAKNYQNALGYKVGNQEIENS